jgi:sugar/nucleoside kinase (ribokinase family)
MHIPGFPILPGSVHRLTYLDLGPGGAANIAIMGRRFGLPVTCLGEIGDDIFGKVILDGLNQEGVDIGSILIKEGASTPMAGVIVDPQAEPAYLGIARGLDLDSLPAEWVPIIQGASAVFADGWAEHPGVPRTILAGFETAQTAGVPVFFDPGPGNPDIPEEWVLEAIKQTDVLLVNQEEGSRFAKISDPDQAARELLSLGPEMVVLKLGPEGNTIYAGEEVHHSPGFDVEAVDQTGAGDSVTGAIIYGWLNGFKISDLGILANATGAAKVLKRGTGRNLPTLSEIKELLENQGQDPGILP